MGRFELHHVHDAFSSMVDEARYCNTEHMREGDECIVQFEDAENLAFKALKHRREFCPPGNPRPDLSVTAFRERASRVRREATDLISGLRSVLCRSSGGEPPEPARLVDVAVHLSVSNENRQMISIVTGGGLVYSSSMDPASGVEIIKTVYRARGKMLTEELKNREKITLYKETDRTKSMTVMRPKTEF